MTNVGFIGLGAMGYPMAENLVKKLPASSVLYVFDVVSKVLEQFVEASNGKAIACSSAKDVAQKSELIFSIVPEGSHVRKVFLDDDSGVLAADVSGKILIDCSTIDTLTNSVVAEAVSKSPNAANTKFYDAPVSGGVIGAVAGTLTFMLGCSDEDPNVDYLKSILSLMGKNIFTCGGPSMGLTAKLANNYLSGLIAIATSEAMNFGIRSGLDAKKLASIFAVSTAQNYVSDKVNPVPGVVATAPSSNGYKGGFKVELMKKDFKLAVEAADRVGAKLVLGRPGLEVYEGAAVDERCRGLDSRVVYRYLGGIE